MPMAPLVHCTTDTGLLISSRTVRLVTLPQRRAASNRLGEAMKLVYVCYAALGYAVARWIFQRQPVPVMDPVTRFRSSGLL